jgi:DNA mismatch repair protein MutS
VSFPVDKTGLPPMMVQYVEYKERYSDALLFFQVGDFYELFYDDAVTVSSSLNLTLTSRDKNSANPIPMCGVPLSVLDSYIDRLLPLGFSVAVVSQTGSGQGVTRALERFVTPGMRLFTDSCSDQGENFIVAAGLSPDAMMVSVAFTDPQTGTIFIREDLEISEAGREIGGLSARELILPQRVEDIKLDGRSIIARTLSSHAGSSIALRFRNLDALSAGGISEVLSGVRSELQSLSATTKNAIKLLVGYLDEISIGNVVPIVGISVTKEADTVAIDAATRDNLELFSNSRDGSSVGSLFHRINRTCTGGGRRLLRRWLSHPQRDISELMRRQEGVEILQDMHADVSSLCKGMSDLERIAARLQLGLASPKDMGALRDTLERVLKLQDLLAHCKQDIVQKAFDELVIPEGLLRPLQDSLVDSPPHKITDGGIVRAGFNPELDRITAVRESAEAWRNSFELQERSKTGIPALKVKSNGVLGYFIEISKAQSSKAPSHYQRRQSTANTERFIVPELQEFESEITSAINKQSGLEMEIFLDLRKSLQSYVADVRRIASSVSLLDVLSSLGCLADENNWIKPQLYPDRRLRIHGGRHPVIEKIIGGSFIPNSITFDIDAQHCCCIVTGPNMGGKSTFLRQVALITILAQIGSNVPASSAEVGVVDRIFARLGAADNLHEGESTFMVEMREASYIINHATDKSLVLIDELGRGTATSDGQSLAQAILEELSEKIRSRTLFATHYHDLTALAETGSAIRNLSVGSIDDGEKIVFTHSIEPGPARKSYGLEVAKLSGLPVRILDRASSLLESFSSNEETNGARQGSLFDHKRPVVIEKCVRDQQDDTIRAALQALTPDNMTPRQALESVYSLKALISIKD